MTGRAKLRLGIAAAMFVGWLAWLGYTALAKNRGPVVSRAQAAAAVLAVHAEVPGGDGPQAVTVKHVYAGTAPGGTVTVRNLTDCPGYEGKGEYLLLLGRDRGDTYSVVGYLRSPGYDHVGMPTVYPWTPAVQAQAEARFR